MKQQKMESMFSGILGQNYDLLKLICPQAAEMSRLVGETLAQYTSGATPLQVLELGGGTGITTLALLTARDDARIVSVDSAAAMQNQAKQRLAQWAENKRLYFCLQDALTALHGTASESVDVVASAYTLHNFREDYRSAVLAEIYRVLKPGGLFINGDRYALDDPGAHTKLVQEEVGGYFKVLTEMQRIDLLEQWIVHLFSDESEHHVMRESKALKALCGAGFKAIEFKRCGQVNALVTALKVA